MAEASIRCSILQTSLTHTGVCLPLQQDRLMSMPESLMAGYSFFCSTRIQPFILASLNDIP